MDFNEQLQADTLWFDLSSVEPDAPSDKASKRKMGMLVMVDSATRFMAVRTIPDESSNSLMKAVEREWIRYFGPPKQLSVDEWSGWGSDTMMQWSGDHDIEMKISPGQSHSRTSIVEQRHQLLRTALSIFMTENELRGLDGLHTALNWTVPTLNQCTFVNGFTPMQLALGKQPNMPGLISDERTGPIQLQQTEQDRLRRRLELKASAQNACAVAEIDVKLRRALLRRFSGADEDLQPGERCLYWREVGNRFHTVQWKGPTTVVAVQRDPDTGTIDTYWIAHGTCSSVPDVNMSDDLLAKKVLSMELNVLNRPLLVSVNVELSEQPTCGASTSTPWRSLRVRSLMDFLMSPLQRKPRPTILLIKVSKMPQQHDLNQCDHFPMSQLNPSMICQKILLKIHLYLWLIRLLAWTCQRIPVWTCRMSQGAWIWICTTLKSHNPHSKLKQQQHPPAERQVLDLCLNLFRKMFQSLMVMTVKLISPPLQLTTPPPNLQCLRHLHNFPDFPLLNADGNMNEVKLLGCDLHCGPWCMITLILKASKPWQIKTGQAP